MKSQEPETVTFTKVVRIADADGRPIRLGSVLREINDGERGVVTRIVREGEYGTIFDSVGDLQIYKSPGSWRCTNRYDQWRHIPKDEQTYEERLLSWRKTPFDADLARLAYSNSLSDEVLRAIDGIMAILPTDIVPWESGPWPDSIEQALAFVVEHLESLQQKEA